MISRLQTSAFYGLRTDVTGNAYCLNDDEVVYLVGNTLVVHNFHTHRQRLNRLPEKRKINFMTISPNKKYAALCEMGDKPLLTIHDLQTLKRKRVFGVPSDSSGVTSFTSACFTYDNRYIAAITKESQTMLFYNYEKGKLESSLEVGNSQIPTSTVNLIASNPTDSAIIAVGGMFVFKFLTLSETIWRPYGFSKADNFHVTSIAWLNSDRLLAGTMDGRIMFLENGDLKNIYKMSETTMMNFKIKEEFVVQNTGSQSSLEYVEEYSQEIASIINFNKGFGFSLGCGKIIVFEKDGQFKYSRRNVYMIPTKILNNIDSSLFRVNTMSLNPTADKLIITTRWSQVFCVTLWGPEYTSETEPPYADLLGNNLHHGPILGLSTCTWKSQIVTYGETDRSVRVWDYESQSLIMMKQYLQDISCVVLHPSGLFCLIGFSDKLRFMSILIDDFLSMKEFSIRSCKIASFSNAGHLFAAINVNIIQVYSVIDFNLLFVLKGHLEITQRIIWSQDDMKIVSIGTEGAIYQWDMNTGKRLNEIVLKQVALHGLGLSADGKLVYCICSNNQIHEIKGNSIINSYALPGIEPKSIAMGKHDSLMFITYSDGYIISLKLPLQNPIEYNEYHVHMSSITQMNLSYNEKVLITTDLNGSICFWKVLQPDTQTKGSIENILYFDQILISRDNLADKVQMIKDLNVRLKELEAEHTYKTHQMHLEHHDKMMEIHQTYFESMEELRDKIDKLEHDHTNEINSINVDIERSKKTHEEAMRQMEISYDAKLIVEYDKSSKLEETYDDMVHEYERKLDKLAKDGKNELEKTITKYEALMLEKQLQLQEAHEEIAQKVHIHEIIKTQIEDDTDREIVDLRTSYESKLFEERQVINKLKGEAGVLRNKQKDCQIEVEDIKWQLKNLREEYTQLMSRKDDLEKNVASLKDEVSDKESTIIDKNKNISDLNRANKELEKYKFVLNERIIELRAEIEPRDNEIAELKEKVTDMEKELMGLNKMRQNLEQRQDELNGKLRTLKAELNKEEQNRKRYQRLVRKIRVDLLQAVGLIDEPMVLKNMVIKLYRRYSDVDQFLRNHKADMDAQCEFMKQRSHLENTISLLKKQVAKVNPGVDTRIDRLMEENIMLLTEINGVREELTSAQRHIADMETLLGLRARDMTPMEARAKLAKAVHANEELEHHYKSQLQECQRIIAYLKETIDRLTGNFLEPTPSDANKIQDVYY